MSLYIASLNSGSNGNCYYVGNDQEAILIDAGISCREIEKRMKRLGLSLNKVKAVFVSHEHTDHISGIPILARKHQLPIYITPLTLLNGRMDLDRHLIMHFSDLKTISLGTLSVTAFRKFHDAAEPHSFTISGNGVTVGIFTDIGTACDRVVYHFKQCHAAFLESNYDDSMLDKGTYPYHLKSRIRGLNGHLSNKQALDLFVSHRPSFMTHLLLSHLSKNNNSPELVSELFTAHAENVRIVVASRYEESRLFYIENKMVAKNVNYTSKRSTKPAQLTFAFG